MNRLKSAEVKPYRELRLELNANRCELCGTPVALTAVLDHDHATGLVRGVIHNGCNVVLGKVENSAKRYGVNLAAFAAGLSMYLSKDHGDVIHPTHRTSDEKKVLAKKRRARRLKCPG